MHLTIKAFLEGWISGGAQARGGHQFESLRPELWYINLPVAAWAPLMAALCSTFVLTCDGKKKS